MTRTITCAAAVVILACSCQSSTTSSNTGDPQPAPPNRAPAPAPGSISLAASAPTRVDPPAGPGAMAPNLTVVNGAILAVWIEPGAGKKTRRLRFARYDTGTWSSAVTIVDSTAMFANWADIPTVTATRGGDTLVAHWAKRSSSAPDTYAYDVALVRSTDGGKTWKAIGSAHKDGTKTEHGFVSMVDDGNGVRAFWLDGRQTAQLGGKSPTAPKVDGRGAMTLRTAHIDAKPQPSESLDSRVCDCCGTDAVQTSAGPIIIYRNRTKNEVRDIWIVRREGTTWTAPKPVHADGWRIRGCPVNGPAAAASGNRLVVAWYTYANNRPTVRLAFSNDAGASFDRPIIVDQARGKVAPMGRVDVVLTASNEAIVSWLATGRDKAAILARRVARDGRMSTPVKLATTSASRGAGFPRLALARSLLLLMWTGATEPTRLRALRIPLSHIPAATRKPDTRRAVSHTGLLKLGAKLPKYTARDLNGNPVGVAKLRGKPLLLNVWATWCEPCRRETPELRRLHRQYAARGLHVVGVSIDSKRNAKQVKRFARRARLPYSVWLDHDDRASRVFGVGVVPATFLFDAGGALVWRHVGPVRADDASLRKALGKALAKP